MVGISARNGFGVVNPVCSKTGVSMSAVIAFTCSSAIGHLFLAVAALAVSPRASESVKWTHGRTKCWRHESSTVRTKVRAGRAVIAPKDGAAIFTRICQEWGAEHLEGFGGSDRLGELAVGAQFVGSNTHEAIGEWEVPCFIDHYEERRSSGWVTADPANPGAQWRFELACVGPRSSRLPIQGADFVACCPNW